MSQCMKDHPIEDIKEKLDDARPLMAEDLYGFLNERLSATPWVQASLNELFHALKRLEKHRSEEERTATMREIQSIVKKQS